MRPFKSIRKAWARASFAQVIPAVAFVLALLLATVFTFYYFDRAHQRHQFETRKSAVALADYVSRFSHGETGNDLNSLLGALAPDLAEIRTAEGQLIAGSLSEEASERASVYPVELQGQPGAQLVYAPITVHQPPMPYSIAIAIICVLAVIASFLMYIFARLAARYVNQVTATVNEFSLQSASHSRQNSLMFKEFRTLNTATIRTTRRVAREIKALRRSALTDERTGLMNEKALNDHIRSTLDQATFATPAALIMMEFQAASESNVRAFYDLPEKAYAAIGAKLHSFAITALARRGLTKEQWGAASLFSDHFAILIPEQCERESIASFVRELQNEFRTPLYFDDVVLNVELTGSVVIIPEDGDSVQQIRQRARDTLIDMKAHEKTGFAFYSPRLERQREAKVRLEAELREAVAEERFVPLFQPKIDLATGRICGAEALARWQLENGRLVAPSVFIELAEETGLIYSLGEQIMRKATQEAAEWTRQGYPLNLAVNVSPRQFSRDGLNQMILDALTESGLSPRQLELEITESLAIQHPDRVRAVLDPLRKLGIKLAMDDFGTGHSNLAVLTQFDFDVFKIDRQFVSGTPDDKQANAIVEMILSMAQTLEIQIVGEGIETPRQAAFLKKLGCNISQGYLYSPPVTAEVFRRMLDEQPFAPQKLTA